jgi:hypothetical protein
MDPRLAVAACLCLSACLSEPSQYQEPPAVSESLDAAPPDRPQPAPPRLPPQPAPEPPTPDARAPAPPDAAEPDAAPDLAPDVEPVKPDMAPDRSPDIMVQLPPPPPPPPKRPPPPPCPVKCSDGTCAQVTWNFERVDLGGITATVGSASALREPISVRLGVTGRALAADVDLAAGNGVLLTVPICDSGTLDARRKALRGSVRLQGPEAPFAFNVLFPGPVFAYKAPFVSAPAILSFESNVENLPAVDEKLREVTKFLIAVDARVAWRGTIWFDDLQVVDR